VPSASPACCRPQSEFLYFSFVALTTLGFGDLSPAQGLPQALTVLWVRQTADPPGATE
jgi:hypothetical protein